MLGALEQLAALHTVPGVTLLAVLRAHDRHGVRLHGHSAPVALAFYTGRQFPPAYHGDAFVALRGSWNRVPPSAAVRAQGGTRALRGRSAHAHRRLPHGAPHAERTPAARPTGLAVTRDGALLVSDDMNGVTYRVSHAGAGGAGGR